MAKKVNEIDNDFEEKILEVEYSEVMQKSYIDYAMSVIISRAIPDIRDGLKPVQRRTIYDMAELGAASDKPYKKSARITGDTMGKYHPHGDSSIYDAMVVMAQDFKKGRNLIDGHGNFGSIEGDGAAAQRYTEVRLDKFSERTFLYGLKEDTVDFVPNYDESEQEPAVLPCRIPNFLINGSEGIAVGMTTSTPPHNIAETIDAAVHFLDYPDTSVEKLMEILPGPDFPTGGIIANKSDLPAIYKTGTGKIKIRGKIEFEAGRGSVKDKLIITEIPYTMVGDGINRFLQQVADLVEDRTLTEIFDITNQTSSEGIQIVLELKKGADIEYIKSILYKKTRLEDTFGVNMLAVYDGKPVTMNLCSILKAFCDFQYEIYTRMYTSLLNKVSHRIEILEGLIKATGMIDLIIEVLRGSKTVKQSKACLMNGNTDGIAFKTKTAEKKASSFNFTEAQTDAILSMTMARLVGLEIELLEKELKAKKPLAEKYSNILNNKNEMKKEIKKELISLKEEFGEPRKTIIVDAKPIVVAEKEEAEVDIAVLVDKFFYIHSVDWLSYEKNAESIKNDYKYIVKTTNKAKLVVFCHSGKAHIVKTSDIPYGKIKDKGQPIDNICNYDSKLENIVGMTVTNAENPNIVFLSSDGFIKVVNVSEFDVTRKTVDATKLKEGNTLLSVHPYLEDGYFALGTKKGYFIRFKQKEIPEQKKNAVGAIAIKLAEDDVVINSISTMDVDDSIVVDDTSICIEKIKMMKRGGKGTKTRI